MKQKDFDKCFGGTKVYQYTVFFKLVETYDAIKEASKKTGISYEGISNCARNRQKTAGGYVWTKEPLEKQLDNET